MYRTLKGSFEQIDNNMGYVARTLELSEKQIFYKIVIPLAYLGIIRAVVLFLPEHLKNLEKL